jgi:hypothetical protein
VAPAPLLPAAPRGIRGRIVALARSQLGYRDHGDFCTRYGPCEVWCSLFATWVWNGGGVPIGILPFTGSVYDWATLKTYVLPRRARPRPGDVVLYGRGPATVDSSVHMGIVEAVYPGYLVTIEGDLAHGVRRMVVPVGNAKRVGELAGIYGYASPVPAARASAFAPTVPPPTVAAAKLRRAIAHQDRLTPQDRRLRRTIRALRAFQHMPYAGGGVTIEWVNVNAQGRIAVAVVSPLPPDQARAAWQEFLARYGDDGGAYDVAYYAPRT